MRTSSSDFGDLFSMLKRLAATVAALLSIAGAASAASLDVNNPTGSQGLILIDKLGRHIRFFDPVSLKELSNFEVGVAPHDIAISPDHKTAYVPIYGDGV